MIRNRFEDGDKASLALSLARCFLHIPQVHIPRDLWTEWAWTEDSIQFLHRNSTSEILDVHHPYILYSICHKKHNQESAELQAERYRVTLMSLARFLLEIQIGRDIDMELSSSADLDGAKNKLLNLWEDEERQNDAPKHYMRAIRGCLNFRASLESLRKAAPRSELGDLVRSAIYTNIIKPLYRNLSVVPKHQRFFVPRNVKLNAPAYRSTYPDANSSPNGQLSCHRRSTVQLAQSPPLISTGIQPQNHSASFSVVNGSVMFDGKTVDADHE